MIALSYREVHVRVRSEHGHPALHACVGDLAPCPHGAQAAEWSCNTEDADVLLDATNSVGFPTPYSPDATDYVPRCVSCHRKHDHRVRREERLLNREDN